VLLLESLDVSFIRCLCDSNNINIIFFLDYIIRTSICRLALKIYPLDITKMVALTLIIPHGRIIIADTLNTDGTAYISMK
jgi:hypothetical protein